MCLCDHRCGNVPKVGKIDLEILALTVLTENLGGIIFARGVEISLLLI